MYYYPIVISLIGVVLILVTGEIIIICLTCKVISIEVALATVLLQIWWLS